MPRFLLQCKKMRLLGYLSKLSLQFLGSYFLVAWIDKTIVHILNKRKLNAIPDSNLPLNYKKIKLANWNWNQELLEDSFLFTDYLWFRKPYRKLLHRAEEIKNIYKDTHYVFIHAQSSKFTPLYYFINYEFKQELSHNKFFKLLRAPSVYSEESIQNLIQKAQNGNDHDIQVRKIMISADAYYGNKSPGESAQYYLSNNASVHDCIDILINNLFLDNPALKKKYNRFSLRNKFYQLNNNLEEKSCGNLWVICIPKQLIKDQPNKYVYQSHAYGKLCTCHAPKEIQILENLQDNLYDKNLACEYGHIPQYRIIIPELSSEKQIYSFFLTSYDKQYREAIKRHVKQIMNDTKKESSPSKTIGN